MSNLTEQVEQSILTRRLFRRGQAILVAVSGGLDSMVLLHLLAGLSKTHRWHLTVAHFNHRLRGQSSDADERLARNTVEKLGLRFFSESADVKCYGREHGVSIEMAARKLRHEFLARMAATRKISTIAIAHHADDQVELFFLRLLRGAGAGGLAGMKWRNPSPANPKIILVRPLLEQPKSVLQAHAQLERIPFREDATNAQVEFRRNRIRHELLPLLTEKYQPALFRVVLRQMDLLQAESDFVADAALSWLQIKRRPPFETLPTALQRRCLQLQFTQKGVEADFELIEAIRGIASQPVAVSKDMSVWRDRSGLLHLKSSARAASFDNTKMTASFRGRAGEISHGNMLISWQLTPVAIGTFRAPKPQVNCELFDADKVGNTIVLRRWRSGDRFQPIGMKSPVKLQDLFVNQKILRSLRHGLIVGTTVAGELFWVEGLRMAECFKLDKNTSRQLKWSWNRL